MYPFTHYQRALALLCMLFLWGCDEDVPKVGAACADLADCSAGDRLVCSLGSCQRVTCSRSAQCPSESACVDQFCDVPECAESADCAAGACFEGDCRTDICESREDCLDEVCSGAPPTCRRPPASCVLDDECPLPLTCVLPFGACKPTCTTAQDCAEGDYCRRGQCTPTCIDSTLCGAAESCVNGACVEVGECSDQACPASRPFRNPVSCACVSCLNGADCLGEQQSCVESGRCVYCPSSGDSASCALHGLLSDEGCCTECLNDVDCAGRDQVCKRGRCDLKDPRECTLDSDCANRGTCENGLCRPGGTLAPCELQSGCEDGEACYADQRCRVEGSVCECEGLSRCVAEPLDVEGVCRGCSLHCDATDCQLGSVCVVPENAAEGYCISSDLAACP